MPKVEYTTTVEIPKDTLWNFVKDFSNWGPMLKGYQSHEMINDKESIWIIKGKFGTFSRTTKFHNTITEWDEGKRVAFNLKGMNDPVDGYGWVNLNPDGTKKGTIISSEIGIEAGGIFGPLINRIVKAWLFDVAEDLVSKIVEAVKK